MGLLADGAKLLADLQAESDGETVTYSRPGVIPPVPITAVCSVPEVAVDASTNLPARTESGRLDLLFRSVDLLAALGLGTVPQKGDRIDRTIAGRIHRYATFADDQSPAWEYGDPDYVTVRVHARLAEVVP